MYLYSTKTPSITADLKEAVLKGLPEDNGLFMPSVVSRLPDQFLSNLLSYDFQEIALAISRNLLGDTVPREDLRDIIENAITFDAPLVKLSESEYVLELFHGPSLAFKDFGARFMAGLMSYLIRGEDRELKHSRSYLRRHRRSRCLWILRHPRHQCSDSVSIRKGKSFAGKTTYHSGKEYPGY